MPSFEGTVPVLAVLCGAIVLSEWLVRRTFLRHVGTALLVIVVTAVLANLRIVPTYGNGTPLYDALFGEVIALAIFWLLLRVELRQVLRAGPAMLGLFAVGSIGIALGVTVAMWAVGGTATFGEHGAGLGAMFVGTYTGGSLNFNTLATIYRVMDDGALYAGAAVVDSLMTTVWMVVGVLLPRMLGGRGGKVAEALDTDGSSGPDLGLDDDSEQLHPIDLGLALGLGLGALAASRAISLQLDVRDIVHLHPNLILTLIALLLAQVPAIGRIKGTRVLGMFAVYLFLATIGALCDLNALASLGALAPQMLLFVSITLAVHGVLVFGAARLFGIAPELASVASQAGVGGGSSALALARSLGRSDLVLPAILVGSLGTATGTFLGMVVGSHVLGGATVG
ncbi:DUF819 domain-containing protein [Engelhardtia mirabilis]|uniref:DUF819 family protein n=1 Tax=Engelhardtia mirabilis TaxID=2528011 RepID=A0A518BIN0_9BACT|nr:hypothetical protein Pla133_19160 [Planctomycetes bacterium Pla133]QDV01166.1 hypothetical protein Pla86_19150 [Planctomycetes bacterium Pla86]